MYRRSCSSTGGTKYTLLTLPILWPIQYSIKVSLKRGSFTLAVFSTRLILKEMGLERVGGRLREVSAEILRRWKGSRDDAHLYINLLELEKKAEAWRRLEEIRLKRKPE